MFNPKSAGTPDGNNFVQLVQLVGTNLVFTSDSVASPAFSGSIDLSAFGTDTNDIDFVNNVQLVGQQLQFTGTGNAFTGNINLPGSSVSNNGNGTVNLTTTDNITTNNIVTGQQSTCTQNTVGNVTTTTFTMNNGDVCAIAVDSSVSADQFLMAVTCDSATLDFTYVLSGGGTVTGAFAGCFPALTDNGDGTTLLTVRGPAGQGGTKTIQCFAEQVEADVNDPTTWTASTEAFSFVYDATGNLVGIIDNAGTEHPIARVKNIELTGAQGYVVGATTEQCLRGTYYREINETQTGSRKLTQTYNVPQVNLDAVLSSLRIIGTRTINDVSNASLQAVSKGNSLQENMQNALNNIIARGGGTTASNISVAFTPGGLTPTAQLCVTIGNVGTPATLDGFEFVFEGLDSSYAAGTAAWTNDAVARNFIYEIQCDATGNVTGLPAGQTEATLNIPQCSMQDCEIVYERIVCNADGTTTRQWLNVIGNTVNTGTVVPGDPGYGPLPMGTIGCKDNMAKFYDSSRVKKGKTIASNTVQIWDADGNNDTIDLLTTDMMNTGAFSLDGDWYYRHLVTDNDGLLGVSCGCFTPDPNCVQ